MKDNKSNTLLLTVIAIATLLVTIIGATFAYFTNTVSDEAASKLEVISANLLIEYAGGQRLTVTNQPEVTGVEPRDEAMITKRFTVTEASNDTSYHVTMPYTIYLVITENTFTGTGTTDNTENGTPTNSLSYDLTATGGTGTEPTAAAVTNGRIPDSGTNGTNLTNANITINNNVGVGTNLKGIVLGTGSLIGSSKTVHNYELKIYFKDPNINQDADKGKTFSGYVTVAATGSQSIQQPANE